MATRGMVFLKRDNGTYEGIYNHYDSYPDGLGDWLAKNVKTQQELENILALGDHSSIQTGEYYNEGDENVIVYTLSGVKEAAKNCGSEWAYVFDSQTNTWQTLKI